MADEKLYQELLNLEDKIETTKYNIANNNFYPNNSPSAKEAAKADLKQYEYRYKKMTMDLTDADKKELARLGEEKGFKLKMLDKLAFTEEEKEECRESMSFFETPFKETNPELNRLLDEEEAKKKAAKKAEASKKKGFHLFGKK